MENKELKEFKEILHEVTDTETAQENSDFPALFLSVWVLVRVFQKMQKIGTPDRLPVLVIKIRKSKEKD